MNYEQELEDRAMSYGQDGEEEECEVKAVLWTGGNAPNREATLKVSPTYGPRSMQFCAYWEPGYCGCPDCHPMQGFGATEAEAIADYWQQWEEEYQCP